ncbi:enoyl-CoA hydratase/isomerase family protein [Hymenobacter lapidiphilus]|uniref:Enoyl-CoA hydratase/isomerase family protein n=1 Tax=Hymenobacter lapidiphilus TaxID=2608003 RepID=A0A7Y7PQT3_9BACT|nr:enoyl-CoA hydratase/isomerase family protein [Hymenobacter lapidiphilus]NVO32253.1 enoyl-CoA hydratase/isomerase family protein [Hymenobacter lapidiphilus]
MSSADSPHARSSRVTLAEYQHRYRHVRLSRTDNGILTAQLHSDGGPLIFALSVYEDLLSLFYHIGADRENRVLILTGTGDAFIGGADLGNPAESGTPEGFDEYYSRCKLLGLRHLELEVPIIAALNGPVLFHNELALLCDVLLATDNVLFRDAGHLPGRIVPGDGVQVIWQELLGPVRIKHYLWLQQQFTAQQLLEWGIVAEVLPSHEALLARARAIAQDLSQLPPLTLRYTRQALNWELRRKFTEQLGHGMALEGITVNDVFVQKAL